MKRRSSQPSPNLPLACLPKDCEATADEIIRQIVEGYHDRTRKVRKEAA